MTPVVSDAPPRDWTRVRTRELPEAEWEKIRAPLDHLLHGDLPDPARTKVLVAEEADGTLVGYVLAYVCVHVEPIWVHPDYRRKPGVIRKLWRGAARMLQALGTQWAFATIAIQDAPSNQALAGELGFTRLAADLYLLEIPPASATLEADTPPSEP